MVNPRRARETSRVLKVVRGYRLGENHFMNLPLTQRRKGERIGRISQFVDGTPEGETESKKKPGKKQPELRHPCRRPLLGPN
jgi:hypothetical protein